MANQLGAIASLGNMAQPQPMGLGSNMSAQSLLSTSPYGGSMMGAGGIMTSPVQSLQTRCAPPIASTTPYWRYSVNCGKRNREAGYHRRDIVSKRDSGSCMAAVRTGWRHRWRPRGPTR
jgi:hypothetical protein